MPLHKQQQASFCVIHWAFSVSVIDPMSTPQRFEGQMSNRRCRHTIIQTSSTWLPRSPLHIHCALQADSLPDRRQRWEGFKSPVSIMQSNITVTAISLGACVRTCVHLQIWNKQLFISVTATCLPHFSLPFRDFKAFTSNDSHWKKQKGNSVSLCSLSSVHSPLDASSIPS